MLSPLVIIYVSPLTDLIVITDMLYALSILNFLAQFLLPFFVQIQDVKSLFRPVCVSRSRWLGIDMIERESVIQKSYLQILDTNPLSSTLILIPSPAPILSLPDLSGFMHQLIFQVPYQTGLIIKA